ncbi:hypothetical protein [Flavitalea sp.]|nr:hypothetical protein [Flavitalea sp.]
MNRFWVSVLLFFLPAGLIAQDTLPKFSASSRGNSRNLISWINAYPVVTQLNIQRSTDSARNFKTILTVPDPKLPQNGFVDTKAPIGNVFYRLFIVLDSGKYVFSRSQRAYLDTSAEFGNESKNSAADRRVIVSANLNENETEKIKEKLEDNRKAEPEKFFVLKRRDSVIAEYSQKYLRRFRDSVISRTKDTLVLNSIDTVVIKPFIPIPVYKPSQYVFTEKEGNVTIALPQALQKKYSIRFFEDDNSALFEIKHVKQVFLTLDKSNFHHAGWFKFELYEDENLKEKHRFFISKDF